MSCTRVTCCHPRSDEAGFATPSALLFSLALALVGAAIMVRNVQDLILMRADMEKARQSAALDGAHFQAAAAIVRSGVAGPYHWGFTTDVGWVDVVAEPEAAKLSLAAAGTLTADALAALGIQDLDGFHARLAQATSGGDDAAADLDAAPAWKACGPSVVSAWGQQAAFVYAPRQAPGPSPNPASWHIGEVWRVHVATLAGWSDDRIVRFTGDARRPAAIVTRVLSRSTGSGVGCDSLLEGLFGAA
jgi:hypothetical protein